MSKIAIITARGGSKRIPKKNIKPFLGKPIIAYSIEAALKSELFEEVMVSTDDNEIASIAKEYGASVPFLRSDSAADDNATTADALLDVFEAYNKLNRVFDYACCLYPTAPFVTATKLKDAYNELVAQNFDSVFPVMKFSYPIWRSLKKDGNMLKMNWPEYLNSRSQDLLESFHDAGQFYFLKVESFLRDKKLFSDNSGGIVIDDLEGQDIDSFSDWKLAELKYQLMQSENEGIYTGRR